MTTPASLLLLHGAGDSGTCWAPFVHQLRLREGLGALTVVTPDAPAHGGRTAEPGHTPALADQAAEATGHAEALVVGSGGPIVLGGHSMGSGVAMAVAAARPDLVAALFLEDPPFPGPLADAAHAAPIDLTGLRDWCAGLQAMALDEVVAMVRAQNPDWAPDEYEPWARAKQVVDTAAFGATAPWEVATWARDAQAVRCPVVVVAGVEERGSMLSSAAASDLSATPGWTVHRLSAGHDVRRDAPQATADLLADLIRSVPA